MSSHRRRIMALGSTRIESPFVPITTAPLPPSQIPNSINTPGVGSAIRPGSSGPGIPTAQGLASIGNPNTNNNSSQPTFGFFDQTDADGNLTQQGLVNPVLGGLTSVFNIYSGLKSLKLQEEGLDFQKDAFNRNFAASKAAFENQLRGQHSRSAFLGGQQGVSSDEFVANASNF